MCEQETFFRYVIYRVGSKEALSVSLNIYPTREKATEAGKIRAAEKYPDEDTIVLYRECPPA